MNGLNTLSGLNGLNTIGNGSSNQDITPEELLLIAKAQGGSIGAVADELTHPEKSILSTIGSGFKNLFKGFIDVISLPGEIISGAISKDYTIGEAIDKHKSISDAIFGSKTIDFNGDGNETTMEKVGNFIVRTPFDILLDPTTYITFGAGPGSTLLQKMGLSLASNSKVSILKEGEIVSKSLSDIGQETLSYARKYIDQATGRVAADNMIAHGMSTGALKKQLIESGVKKEDIALLEQSAKALLKSREVQAAERIAKASPELTDAEFKDMLKSTLEAPLDMDMAKKVMSNLMTHSPQLVETMIDKGGIKFMGKSILSAQRVSAAVHMIPGMNFVDEVTLPLRNAILAPFDAGLVKSGGKYIRVPEEFLHLETQLKDLTQARKVAYGNNLDMVKKALKLNSNEIDGLMTAIQTAKMPQDARLGKAYLQLQGMQEKDMAMFVARGIPKAKLDMYVGNVLLPNETGKAFRNGTFRAVPSTAEHATNAKLIMQSEMPVMHNDAAIAKAVTENLPKDVASEMAKIKSPQELAYAIGKQKDNLITKITKGGKSFEEAIASPEVKKLDDIRKQVDSLGVNKEVVGKLEALGFVEKNAADEIKTITEKTQDSLDKLGIKKEVFEADIRELADRIQEGFTEGVTGNFDKFLKTLPKESQTNAKIILQRIQDYVGRADLTALKNAVKKADVPDALVKGVDGLSREDALAIASKVLKDEAMMPVDIENLNKFVKETLDNKAKAALKASEAGKPVAKTGLSEYEINGIKKMWEQSSAKKFNIVRKEIDHNAMSKLVQVLKDEFTKDPKGVRGIIKSMMGKETKLNDVLSLMDETRIKAQKEISAIPELTQYWVDNEQRIYKRVAATAQELKAVGIEGFDTDLLTSFTFRGMKNIGQLTAHDFMESLVRDFGKWSKEAPPGWVELSSKAIDDKTAMLAKGLVNEAGETMKFHPAVAARFDEMMSGLVMGDEATSAFLKGYDQLLKYWKGSMTSIFPMFHGRNAISNVFQNFLDLGLSALDPRKHFTAIQVMNNSRKLDNLAAKAMGTGDEAIAATKEMSELLNKKFMTDATGHSWTVGELQDVIKNNNIALNKNNLGYMDIADRDKLLTKLYEKEAKGVKATGKKIIKAVTPLNDDFLGFRAGKWVGGGIEDQSRILNFVSNLINTGDVSHAAVRTKMFLFDYGNMTKFEKNFMRRIIPFYTWTRKNLELQFKTFMHAPGRVMAEVKTIKNLGGIFGGEQLTDQEQSLVPAWLKNSLNLKITDKEGKTQLLSGFGLPIEQAFQQFTSAQILGSVSPLIRFPIEKSTGYQWFRGKPTSQVIDASNYKNAPAALKQFIGYSEYQGTTKEGKKYNVSVSLRPENMMTLQNMPFSRIINTLGALTDQSQTDGLKALQSATGIRTFNFDEQLLEQKKQDELRAALEKILTDAGVRGQFIRYYNRKNTKIIQSE